MEACKGITQKYYAGLKNKSDVIKQCKNIKKSQQAYKEGKYILRPKLPVEKKVRSQWIEKFNKKYPDLKIYDFEGIEKKTGIKKNVLSEIFSRGASAYYSSGSRPSATPSSWGYSRVASFIMRKNPPHDQDLK